MALNRKLDYPMDSGIHQNLFRVETMDLITIFLNFAGPWTLLAFLLWLHSIWNLKPYLLGRDLKGSALLALLGASVAFLSLKVDFKVLSDETNLLSVANMLAVFGKASNTEMWVQYYHQFQALDVAVPTRPLLFPLLTSILHGIFGMRETNPFVLNFLTLFFLLFLVLEWGKEFFAHYSRLIFFFGLMMNSVLLISATSAGYDLLSLLFGFIAFLCLKKYEGTGSSLHLRALFLSLVCFASVRYESILALPLVGLYLFVRERKIHWDLYVTVLILILPLFMQRYLTWGSFENPPGVPAFSLTHFVKYFPEFMSTFFVDIKGPYPIALHWLGLAGLLVFSKNFRPYQWLSLTFCLGLLVLFLSHHFGLAGHPTQARLFLSTSFALSLAGIYFLSGYQGRVDQNVILGLFAIFFFHHHHYSMRDPLISQLTMTREVRHIRSYLSSNHQDSDLYIYDRPGQLSALGKSTVSHLHFEANRVALVRNLKDGLYGRFIYLEKVPYGGDQKKSALVREGYRLEPLQEHQISPEEKLRISLLIPAP